MLQPQRGQMLLGTPRVRHRLLLIVVGVVSAVWNAQRAFANANTGGGQLRQRRTLCGRNSLDVSIKTGLEVSVDADVIEQLSGPLSEFGPLALAIVGASTVASTLKGQIDGPAEFDLQPGSLQGRTLLITGGNAGLGLETAIRTARAGATVVVTARTEEKAEVAQSEIRRASGSGDVHALLLDLADLSSVRSFVEKFTSQPYGEKLDVLVNNAGVMAVPTRIETRDGFEQQLGVNHLGHFALTGLLLPLLAKNTNGARVISVSSSAHKFGDADGFWAGLNNTMASDSEYQTWGVYGLSKLANVIFASELDRRFKAAGIRATAVSLHPGVCPTELGRYVVAGEDKPMEEIYSNFPLPVQGVMQAMRGALRPVSRGANTHVFLAAGADGGYGCSGGEYFEDMALAEAHPKAKDAALGQHLWEESEELTGVTFDFSAKVLADGT